MSEGKCPRRETPPAIHYSEYLQLDALLSCQTMESAKYGQAAHDEMLFIITHQAYELWFKQIVHELQSVVGAFSNDAVAEMDMGRIIHLLGRVKTIQGVLLQQIDVIETMTPLDFLEFRDLLVPASGFQSLQFKQIEVMMGIKRKNRTVADQEFFCTRLRPEEQAAVLEMERKPSLLELTDAWLSRMPFLNFGSFDFWQQYKQAVDTMLDRDRRIIENNPAVTGQQRQRQFDSLDGTRKRFDALLDEEQYQRLREEGVFRMSHKGFLASLFIHLYRDQPIIHLPFQFLTALVDIDELFTSWRSRHAQMVNRMLGTKIGTGGSSGADYLSDTTKQNRVFSDLCAISTFLLPRSELPVLSQELCQAMGFQFNKGN